MKNQIKVLGLFLILVLGLAVLPAVSAVNFTTQVKIDGDEIGGSTILSVERGETLDIKALVTADDDVEDVRLRAWVGGYEYDILDDNTGIFNLENGVTLKKTLSIYLPEDMDADEEYTLHIEGINHNVDFEVPLTIDVNKARHLLSVQDVIVGPSTTLEAGDSFYTKVRLENMGYNKEEDIRIVASVPSLGIVAPAVYMDELTNSEIDNEDEEASMSSQSIKLDIPANAKAGEHGLVVEVTYNRGHDTLLVKKMLTVVGGQADDVVEPKLQAVVSVDKSTETLAAGEEAVYTVSFANLGENAQLYSVNAIGAQLWADTRAEPSFVSVAPGQTGTIQVFVKAHDDAEAGNHLLTLQIKEGDKLLKEVVVGAKVAADASTEAGSDLLSSSTLKLGFVGLVVLLVIIGLIIAFRKLREDDDYPLEPKEGQTYY